MCPLVQKVKRLDVAGALVLACLIAPNAGAQSRSTTARGSAAAMDRDLMEVTIPRLESYYRERRYTVTQVVRWYLGRIRRYNGCGPQK
jgi:hypothetical protein